MVLKIDLEPVVGIDFPVPLMQSPDPAEDLVRGDGAQLHFPLRDLIGGEPCLQSGEGGPRVRQELEKKSDPHDRIPAEMDVGEYDAPASLPPDHRARLLHPFGDVDFSDRRPDDFGTVCAGDVVHRPRRGEVYDHLRGRSGASRAAPSEHKLHRRSDRVFFAVGLPFFRDEDEAVHIGVHGNPEVGLLGPHARGETGEVLRYRLGSMGEHPRDVAVDGDDIAPQAFEQPGDDQPSGRVHAIQNDPETAAADRPGVHEIEIQDGVDVALEPFLFPGVTSERFPPGIRSREFRDAPELPVFVPVEEHPR